MPTEAMMSSENKVREVILTQVLYRLMVMLQTIITACDVIVIRVKKR